MGKHRWLAVVLALLALVPAVAQGEPPRIVDFRLETPATTPAGAVGTPPAPAPLPNGQRLPQDSRGVFLVAAGL
ncbi:MAG: hypothetical protein HY335_02580, partial [Deinococcus sp.]|nr:hypothetical protein [Deinococcus sp.]